MTFQRGALPLSLLPSLLPSLTSPSLSDVQVVAATVGGGVRPPAMWRQVWGMWWQRGAERSALCGRPLPFFPCWCSWWWPDQLVVVEVAAGAAGGGGGRSSWWRWRRGRPLASDFFNFSCNVCRASILAHDNFLMDIEILCRASISMHGKAFLCVSKKTHDKVPLPCNYLLCGLCHAFSGKTHDKAFAVRFIAFAVRRRCTTIPLIPVVLNLVSEGARGDRLSICLSSSYIRDGSSGGTCGA
jgi:hypothetical protein